MVEFVCADMEACSKNTTPPVISPSAMTVNSTASMSVAPRSLRASPLLKRPAVDGAFMADLLHCFAAGAAGSAQASRRFICGNTGAAGGNSPSQLRSGEGV